MSAKPHPSASLYVGDLSPEVSEGLLFDVFNNVGPVASIRVCRDTLTKRSLGYAYVNFHSVVDAERALDTLNNTAIKNRPCRIMWVQRDPTIRRSGVGNIFIKNLDPKIEHRELFDTFSVFGNILSCKIVLDENGNSKGYGFVHFETEQSAEVAVSTVNDKQLGNKKVYVGKFVPKKEFIRQKEKSWTNVYVKEIDPNVMEDELIQKFAEVAANGDTSCITSCKIMRDEINNTPRGFGFVNFKTHEQAVQAVNALQGALIGTKKIWCGRAQKMAEREQELKRRQAQLKLQRIAKYQGINLYIKNIEDEITEERLEKEFSAFGQIKTSTIMRDDDENSRGFGFVCFTTPEEANRAITEMNNRILSGCIKPLYVALHEPAELRKQKLAQRNASRSKIRAPQMYGAQPVYYPSNANVATGYVYPQQQQIMQRSRGWPQQPQPQFHQQMPANFVAMPPMQRGRGRGTMMTGGRGRGNMNRRNQNQPTQVQMQDPSILHVGAHNPPMMSDLTLAQLLVIPEEQQKVALGERLYPEILKLQPHTVCGKITGMFLDSGWTIEELYSLLHDENKLAEKVDQAVAVLQRAAAQAQGDLASRAVEVEGVEDTTAQ